jgi:hypothetical protein
MFEFAHRLRIVSLVLGAAVLATFASTGCVAHHQRSYGPSVHTVTAPPRSAAHGYVHHYRDAVLVFDRSWNGYWVRSHPDHYFYSNRYYRRHGGRWQKAQRIGGPWVSIELRALPAGLHQRETVKPRRGAARERREEPREVAKVKREEPRKVAKVKREERREIAESQKPRQVAKAPAGVARGSAKHRGRKVRKDEDEELRANRRVE